MKTKTFIAITLLSGAIAGAILAAINQGIVEPFIDRAIALENQNAAMEGGMLNPLEFESYRFWQKGGEIAAGTILGTSYGALFGIVFAYTRDLIPGSNNKKKALILAAVMLTVLFIVPGLKYPANPPAVGDPETIGVRQGLYIAYLSISGFAALGLALVYRKLGALPSKKAIIPAIYGGVMLTAYFALPPNPDAITSPIDLVMSFRLVSGFTIGVFWGVMAIILGALWDKTKPHETARITA